MSDIFIYEEPNPDNTVACFIRELMNNYLIQFPSLDETLEEEEENNDECNFI